MWDEGRRVYGVKGRRVYGVKGWRVWSEGMESVE